MNKTQDAKYSMYTAVSDYLTVHNSAYSTNVPLNAAIGTFGTRLAELLTMVQQQETNPTGYTADKAEARQAMTDAMLKVATAIQAYANAGSDQTLFQQADYPPYVLKQMSDTQVFATANNLKALAQAHQSSLAPYGITVTYLTGFQTKIDSFQGLMNTPRAAIVTKKDATAQLKVKIKQIDNILQNQIDNLVFAYKDTNPSFYNQYNDMRSVIQTGTSSQVKEGDIDIAITLNLDFRPFTDGHNIRLHNMGNSELEFYRSATPAGPGNGVIIAPNHDLTVPVTTLGTGVFINVRNNGPVPGKYRVTLNF